MTTHSKDFVEIQPVVIEDDVATPIFGETARAANKTSVANGVLDLSPNPDFVDGAYTNLRHFQAKDGLEAMGLTCEPGDIHFVPTNEVKRYAVGIFYDRDVTARDHLQAAIAAAADAGAQGGATHVEIRIS